MNGHCGESTSERIERERTEDRIAARAPVADATQAAIRLDEIVRQHDAGYPTVPTIDELRGWRDIVQRMVVEPRAGTEGVREALSGALYALRKDDGDYYGLHFNQGVEAAQDAIDATLATLSPTPRDGEAVATSGDDPVIFPPAPSQEPRNDG